MDKSLNVINLILLILFFSLMSIFFSNLDQRYQEQYAPVPKSIPMDDFLH